MSSYRKFTFGISSPDEFLVFITPLGQHIMNTHIRKETHIRNVHNKSLTQSQYLAAVTGMLVLKGMLVLSRYVELLIAARDSPLTAALSTPALSTLTSSCYVVACPLPRCPPPRFFVLPFPLPVCSALFPLSATWLDLATTYILHELIHHMDHNA